MLRRTHLAIGLAVALYFVPYVNNKIIFFCVVMIATLLPDIDSSMSKIGKKKIFAPVQMMVGHRGILHTYTFAVGASIVLMFFFPIASLPFFLGYSFHLLADSFTTNGIKPFWPLKYKSAGKIRTGGHIDKVLFVTFVIIDLVLLITLIAS